VQNEEQQSKHYSNTSQLMVWYRLSYGCISISPLPVYMLTKLKLLLIWKH